MSLRSSSIALAIILLMSSLAANVTAWDYDVGDSSQKIQNMKGDLSTSSLENYTLDLVEIGESYPAFRVAGSRGANATADYIEQTFEGLGLNVTRQSFPFLTWDLASAPTLTIDEDGDANTTGDIWEPSSFQTESWSWPSLENGSMGELEVLPIPYHENFAEWQGTTYFPIGFWNDVNLTDKIVVAPREIRWNDYFTSRMISLMESQHPTAIIWVWYYDWMEYADVMFMSSTGGRPLALRGAYLWDLELPSGSLNYAEGRQLMQMVEDSDPVATMKVDAHIAQGEQYNIIADLDGSEDSEKELLITAHYDSVLCDGYVDNAAGVGSMLEIARVMSEAKASQQWDPKYSVRFVAFAGEELGMIGSIFYLTDYGYRSSNVTAMINLDCVGSDDMTMMNVYQDEELGLVGLFTSVAQQNNVTLIVNSETGSDQDTFLNPTEKVWDMEHIWNTHFVSSHLYAVNESTMIASQPLSPLEMHNGEYGEIHTSRDSPNSTGWLNSQAHTGQTLVVLEVAAILSSGDPVYPPALDPIVLGFAVLGVAVATVVLTVLYLHYRKERQAEKKEREEIKAKFKEK